MLEFVQKIVRLYSLDVKENLFKLKVPEFIPNEKAIAVGFQERTIAI